MKGKAESAKVEAKAQTTDRRSAKVKAEGARRKANARQSEASGDGNRNPVIAGRRDINDDMLPPTIPIFPLPNVVLFPNVFLPLHIFEPRYRAMVADALKGDRMIGMVLLRPGWEGDYEGRPPVYPDRLRRADHP